MPSQPAPPHHLSLVAGVIHDIEATNRAFLRIHRHMNACLFSHFVAESVTRIDEPNVETRYLRAAARAGDDKRPAINLYARKHIVVYKGTRQFSVLPHRNIASPAHTRSPLAIQNRKSMHRQACARLHRHAIRSNNTIVKECQSQYANTAEAPPFHASFPSDRTQCDGPQETPYWVQTIRFRARTVQQTQGRAPCSPPRLQI